jgi:Tol biopolymer transport system component
MTISIAAKKKRFLLTILILLAFVTLPQAQEFKVGKTTRLFQTETAEFHTAISNDGSLLGMAQYNRTSRVLGLAIFNTRTKELNSMISYTRGGDIAPSFSPDNSQAVYDMRDEESDLSRIHLINFADNSTKKITANKYNCFRPDWSPDGKEIAFVSHNVLIVMNLAGEHRVLYRGKEGVANPAWSNDGKQILFTEGDVANIKIIEAEGGKPIELFQSQHTGEVWPNWSPCDKFIVFNRMREGRKADLFIRELATGKEFQLTRDDDCRFPVWSPDGSKIYFSKEGDIWEMELVKK